jgi:hypothetical protein
VSARWPASPLRSEVARDALAEITEALSRRRSAMTESEQTVKEGLDRSLPADQARVAYEHIKRKIDETTRVDRPIPPVPPPAEAAPQAGPARDRFRLPSRPWPD